MPPGFDSASNPVLAQAFAAVEELHMAARAAMEERDDLSASRLAEAADSVEEVFSRLEPPPGFAAFSTEISAMVIREAREVVDEIRGIG
jgi:hypothetical protein